MTESIPSLDLQKQFTDVVKTDKDEKVIKNTLKRITKQKELEKDLKSQQEKKKKLELTKKKILDKKLNLINQCCDKCKSVVKSYLKIE